MKFALLVAALVVMATAAAAHPPKWHELTPDYSFEQYVTHFNKAYLVNSAEWHSRKAQFQRVLAKALAHNAVPGVTWHMGVNHLTDLYEDELHQMMGARHMPNYRGKTQRDFVHSGSKNNTKTSVDWRKAYPPVLTAVKDQGMCGDCWAHAVTEAIESSHAISHNGQLFTLSQQQVTSCTPRTGGCYSCNGSYPRLGYDYVAQSENGLVQEWNYPFEGYNDTFPACKHDTLLKRYPWKTAVKIDGFIQVAPNAYDDVLEALNTLGPLSILVKANTWPYYEDGIFTNCTYDGQFYLDHAVMLVGYGYDEVLFKDYWIVRNSWSPMWGENGFMRLERHSKPQCGENIGGMTCYGENPTPTKACGACGILADAQFPITRD